MQKYSLGRQCGKIVALSLFIPAIAVAAVEKEYIDAVKMDFEEFSTGSFNPPGSSSWLPNGTNASADGTDSLESFSKFLIKRYPGTYILFNKLPEVQKLQVLQDYVKTGDLGAIRSNIFSMRRKARGSSRY